MLATGTPAFNKINEYFKENSPFQQAEKQTIEITVTSILPISDRTWQVEWTETRRNLQGLVKNVSHWKASLTIATNPPQQEEKIIINPLGIFITDLNWAQQL